MSLKVGIADFGRMRRINEATCRMQTRSTFKAILQLVNTNQCETTTTGALGRALE